MGPYYTLIFRISFFQIATILKSFYFTKILMHFKYKITKNCDSKSIRYLDCRRQCALVTGTLRTYIHFISCFLLDLLHISIYMLTILLKRSQKTRQSSALFSILWRYYDIPLAASSLVFYLKTIGFGRSALQ